jgi:hypothetical protein
LVRFGLVFAFKESPAGSLSDGG